MANDFAQTVARGLIAQLKTWSAPWQRSWPPGERAVPFNPMTDQSYRGGNTLWLMGQDHSDPRWMTARQADAIDAEIRKGEYGTQIQYWAASGIEKVTDTRGRPVIGDDGKQEMRRVQFERPRLVTQTVFNAEQINGLPPYQPRAIPQSERYARAEAVLSASGAAITHQAGNRAYYVPATDEIVLPERSQFPTADRYYTTALHELANWTGASGRLDRDLSHPFGSTGRARQELRAEIASLMMGTEIGVGHDPSRHAAYAASWIDVLERDHGEIFKAAQDAEKIASMLLRSGPPREQDRDQALNNPAAREVDAGTILVRAPTLLKESHPVVNAHGSTRTYLAVPYAEKDQAKAFGAQWDKAAKSWYAPAGADLAPLAAWVPSRDEVVVARETDPREEFSEALRASGLLLDGPPEMDGGLHRVRVEGDRGREVSGAYVGFLDGHPAGYIQNFREQTQINWKSGAPAPVLNAADRARLAAEAAQTRHERAVRREEQAARAATTAMTAWEAAVPTTRDHPYLRAKGIGPDGLRMGAPGQLIATTNKDGKPINMQVEGVLMVPLCDIDGKLSTIQFIDAAGTKGYLKHGRVEGCHMMIGDPTRPDEPLLIAEGMATGKTLHETTGMPVVAAMQAGNIAPVAQAYRDAYPNRVLIMAGDDDHLYEPKKNAGRIGAEQGAVQVSGYTLFPDFAHNDRGTDWNDYAATNGLAATRDAITKGVLSCQIQARAADLSRQADAQQAQAHELTEQRQQEAYEHAAGEAILADREQDEYELQQEQGR